MLRGGIKKVLLKKKQKKKRTGQQNSKENFRSVQNNKRMQRKDNSRSLKYRVQEQRQQVQQNRYAQEQY